jgi:hypothetical protein
VIIARRLSYRRSAGTRPRNRPTAPNPCNSCESYRNVEPGARAVEATKRPKRARKRYGFHNAPLLATLADHFARALTRSGLRRWE